MKSENVPMPKEMPSVRDVTKILEKEITLSRKLFGQTKINVIWSQSQAYIIYE
jgi:hypothetical protein